jgi:hypothetical protein
MVFVESAFNVVGKVVPNIFTVGRIVKVIRSGSKVTNSANLITIFD